MDLPISANLFIATVLAIHKYKNHYKLSFELAVVERNHENIQSIHTDSTDCNANLRSRKVRLLNTCCSNGVELVMIQTVP